MHAVVPAAGEGTRLRPLTDEKPKGLVEVAGEPLLTHVFERLVEVGVEEVVVVVGYRGEDVRDHYGDSFRGVPIRYVTQSEPRGLADAVAQAGPLVDETFVMLNGDNVMRANLEAVVRRHRESGAAATLMTDEATREEATTTGVCRFDDEGRLTGVVEKPDDPPSTTVLTGCFVFEPLVFHACELVTPSDRGEYELPDAVSLLLCAGHDVETVPVEGWFVNVNTPADRRDAERRLG